MANDIDVDELPYLYEVGTTERVIGLNPTRLYTVYHTGKKSDGSASTGEVYANMQDAAVVATYANGEGKVPLASGGSFSVPSNSAKIRLKTASGDVSLLFVPGERQIGLT